MEQCKHTLWLFYGVDSSLPFYTNLFPRARVPLDQRSGNAKLQCKIKLQLIEEVTLKKNVALAKSRMNYNRDVIDQVA